MIATRPNQWRLSDGQKVAAVGMYEAGMSCGQVADYFGTSRQSMWDVLRRRTTMRPRERFGADNHFWRGGANDTDHAHNIVEKAVLRGVLRRADHCELCGVLAQEFADGRSSIQAHHDDYNDPLTVRWLCQMCHHEWHRHNRPVPLDRGTVA